MFSLNNQELLIIMLLGLLYLVFSRCTDLRDTCTRAGIIAINFTDGPVKNVTNTILDEADELGIKLTFTFTVHQKAKGNIGPIYERVVKRGHNVGLRLNPSRDYDTMTREEIEDDVDRQVEAIDKLSDSKIRCASAPIKDGQGNSDVYDILHQQGILLTSYTFCPYDYEDPMGEFEEMIKTSNPRYDSFIVLLHDQTEGEVPYLRNIVKIGEDNGYKFVNMDECLGDYKGEDSSGGSFQSRSGKGGIESFGMIIPLLILLTQLL